MQTNAQPHRQQGDLINLLAQIGRVGGYTDGKTDRKVNSKEGTLLSFGCAIPVFQTMSVLLDV
jgi:hypothetical protein